MPDEQTTTHDPSLGATEVLAPGPRETEEPHVPIERGAWAHEPGELPPRPRRRLLGVGGNPMQIALLGVLLIACGFVGGVLVEKGQSSSSTTGSGASGLASRFAAPRGGAVPGTTSSSSTAGSATSGGGGFPGRFGSAPGGAVIGEVSYIQGPTLYVTDAE
ncbi:MAG TPA: hypothetical protein VNY52_09650, partial [Solirubrobacteraceae bacterium]|nr:hypothetical protein [Solirubrobacteraceae bacterium]